MTDVVVIGAGEAGSDLARVLSRSFNLSVIVVDRAPVITTADDLDRSGVQVRRGAQAVTIKAANDGNFHVNTVGVRGPDTVVGRVVVLATGAHERTLAGRMIAGTQLDGVYTGTDLRQSRMVPGHSAVVLGADREAFATLRVLRLAGARAKLVVTPWHRHQVGRWEFLLTRLVHAFALRTNSYVTRILGDWRVTGVELTHRDGSVSTTSCDTVILTGDWVPEYELAMRTGLLMDRSTHGPAVDTGGRSSRKGIFAVGSVVHPATGRTESLANVDAVATAIADFVASGEWFKGQPVDAVAPLNWVAPAFAVSSETEGQFVATATTFRDEATLVLTQGVHELGRYELGPISPDQCLTFPADWCADIDPEGIEITARLV